MNTVIYWLGRALIAVFDLLPLTGIAWVGRRWADGVTTWTRGTGGWRCRT